MLILLLINLILSLSVPVNLIARSEVNAKDDSQNLRSIIEREANKNYISDSELNSSNLKSEHLITFSFENKPLVDIIHELAERKKINVILPQVPIELTNLSKQTVSYSPNDPQAITFNEAWRLMQTFLELSGFTLTKRSDDLYLIAQNTVQTEPGIIQEPLPLYIGTKPDKLPKSDQYIRYIYYLRNLKVVEDNKVGAISQIITQLKTVNTPEPILLPKANGLIIVDKANTIASMMYIISELDNTGFKEAIEVLQLNQIPANEVSKIFNSLKLAAGKPISPFIRTDNKPDNITYFAADTTIIADDRTNSLIIMGREAAVSRISDFIRNHLDLPLESGESILHIYDLQYLDAQEFVKILNDLLKPLLSGQQQGQQSEVERQFQGAVAVAEEISVGAKQQAPQSELKQVSVGSSGSLETTLPQGIQNTTITGGNRLIIAALPSDWPKIKNLIQSLDKPQPQVILEVLIVDFTHSDQRTIAGTVRTATDPVKLNDAFQLLASHISPPLNVLGASPSTLAADLLAVTGAADQTTGVAVPSLTSLVSPGSILFSYNDPATPGIMGILQVLHSITNSKIISHPFLITTNNKMGTVNSEVIKRARGPAIPGEAGVTKIEIINLPAIVQVQAIPRLNSLKQMSLQIAVDVNDFTAAGVNSLTRLTRRVETNANMRSGEILVIGGLTRINNNDQITATPLLSDLPIVGYLFKGVTKVTSRTNMAIFISPTIVEPKRREGLNLFTADKIRKGRRDVSEAVLYDDYDPITKWFFLSGNNKDLVKSFVSDSDNAPTMEAIRTSRERKYELKKRPQSLTSELIKLEKPNPYSS